MTGATGFIGFALLNELIKNDVYVYVLCRSNSRRRSRLDGLSGITIIEADLESAESVSITQNCDVFYHLAWEGERNNFTQQYKNIDITVNCMKLAVKLGCKRFICAGSQAEYGETRSLITEDSPLHPTTAYGACKVAAYYLTADLAKRMDIEHTWVRIFSVYGPNDNSNTLIMNLVKCLKENDNFSLATNGEHIWNYLYEEDAARALRMLGIKDNVTGVYNLASRECKPLKYFIEEVRKIIVSDRNVSYGIEESAVNLNVSTRKIHGLIEKTEEISFNAGIKNINKIEGAL